MTIKKSLKPKFVPQQNKRCPHCGKDLPVEHFSLSYYSMDGYSKWCIKCTEIIRKRREKSDEGKPFWIRMDPMLTRPD